MEFAILKPFIDKQGSAAGSHVGRRTEGSVGSRTRGSRRKPLLDYKGRAITTEECIYSHWQGGQQGEGRRLTVPRDTQGWRVMLGQVSHRSHGAQIQKGSWTPRRNRGEQTPQTQDGHGALPVLQYCLGLQAGLVAGGHQQSQAVGRCSVRCAGSPS